MLCIPNETSLSNRFFVPEAQRTLAGGAALAEPPETKGACLCAPAGARELQFVRRPFRTRTGSCGCPVVAADASTTG